MIFFCGKVQRMTYAFCVNTAMQEMDTCTVLTLLAQYLTKISDNRFQHVPCILSYFMKDDVTFISWLLSAHLVFKYSGVWWLATASADE